MKGAESAAHSLVKSCSARAPLQNAQQPCARVERVTCAVSILESFQTALNKVNLSLLARCARALYYIFYIKKYMSYVVIIIA